MGRPYYDFFLRIFGLPLLLLMGIGPLIAWRRTTARSLLKTLRWPIGVAAVTGIVLIVLGAGSSLPGLIAYTFSAFVLTTIVVELVRGTRPPARSSARLPEPSPLRRLHRPRVDRAARDRHRRLERLPDPARVPDQAGAVVPHAGYTATFLGLQHKTDVTSSGNSVETTALLDVKGRFNGTLRPPR